jgi:hypothetical protein
MAAWACSFFATAEPRAGRKPRSRRAGEVRERDPTAVAGGLRFRALVC